MKRVDCLRYLSERITDELVVIALTGVGWEWNNLSSHEGNMKVGSMGNATAVGLGTALALPHRRTVVLESDGSVLLDLATLCTIGTYRPKNLTVFVFDNERYSGSRISEPSATAFNTRLEKIAQGAGIESAVTVRDDEHFRSVADCGLAGSSEGTYVVAKVEEDFEARHLPKPTMDYLEYKYRFTRYIERSEGVSIHPPLH